MREVERIERILNLLLDFWDSRDNKDLRFFQLIDVLASSINLINAKPPGTDVFYVEDDITEAALKRLLENARYVTRT